MVAFGERKSAGEPVVKAIETVESARASAFWQRPTPTGNRGRDEADCGDNQNKPGGTLCKNTDLAQSDIRDRHDQRHTERPCTYTKRLTEANAPLGVLREPANSLDSLLVAAHPCSCVTHEA
jgi:hypothetical protein